MVQIQENNTNPANVLNLDGDINNFVKEITCKKLFMMLQYCRFEGTVSRDFCRSALILSYSGPLIHTVSYSIVVYGFDNAKSQVL